MTKVLEDLISADAGDFKSRAKLRLLRICKGLCVPGVGTEMSITVTLEYAVDRVLYKFLGNEHTARLTLVGMVDPSTSPICNFQEEVVDLLVDWQPSTVHWPLLAAVACDFADKGTRLLARSGCLKLNSGMCEHFVDRLAMPPYSTVAITCDSLDAESAAANMDELFSIPLECLPFICRRWRTRYNRRTFLAEAWQDLRDLGEFADLCIDLSERSHNHVRNDLKSDGPSRSLANTSARFHVRQCVTSHHDKEYGGTGYDGKPVKLDEIPQKYGPACGGSDVSVLLDAAGQDANHPGSAFVRFRAFRLRSFKAMVSPNSALSQEQLDEFETTNKADWARTCSDPDERRTWELYNLVSVDKKREASQSSTGADGGSGSDATFTGLWGSSTDRQFLFDPDAFTAFTQEMTASEKATARKPIVIEPPYPKRYGGDAKDMLCLVQGCYNYKRNICRKHLLNRADADALDALTWRLSSWVGTLDKQDLDMCLHLLWFRDKSNDNDDGIVESTHDRIVLLVNARFQPLCQRLVRCHIDGGDEKSDSYAVPPPPYRVRCSVGKSRLGKKRRALRELSSDTLCHELSSRSSNWEVYSLQWTLPCDDPSLLLHDVFDKGAVVCLPKPKPKAATKPKPKAMAAAEQELLSMGDPLSGSGPSSHAAPTAPTDSGVSEDGQATEAFVEDNGRAHEFAEIDEDANLFEDVPADVIDDINQELIEVSGMDVTVDDPVDDAAVDDDQGEDPDDPPPEPTYTAHDYALASTLDDEGRISCSLPPFSSMNKMQIGRITSWGAGADENKNVSCTCYLHGNCRSPAVKRREMANLDLLVWLYTATLEKPCTAVRKLVLRQMHKDAFRKP